VTFQEADAERHEIVLNSTSARATLGNTCFMDACARIGAQVSAGGLIDPAQTLALLAEPRHLAGKKPRVSLLSIYPSYLAMVAPAILDDRKLLYNAEAKMRSTSRKLYHRHSFQPNLISPKSFK
jgi:hypothetical protein